VNLITSSYRFPFLELRRKCYDILFILKAIIMEKVLLITIGLLCFGACEIEDIHKDMAQFDKAFIPVLYHVYHQDATKAKKAVFNLAFQWQQFNLAYKDLLPENEDWTETFRLVDGWLHDAFVAIDGNRWDWALVQLDHVRFEWMELRMRHRIPYYLDNIWEFQMAYDLVMEVAKDPNLCMLKWDEFEELVYDLNQLWYPVGHERPVLTAWNWDQATFEQFEAHRQTIAECLDRFNESVACADRENLALDCEDINPALWQILALFGEITQGAENFATLQ